MASAAALNLIIGVVDKASAPLKSITGGLSTLGKIAGGVALGGVAALGAGLVKGASAGLSFNNSMEQATARINAFTKDSEATAKILDMVRDRAARTPFAFEEMANAAAALGPAAKQAGVPLEDLIAQAEILAASNPAEGLEGGVFSLKEALSGDFVSIVERFNLPKQRLKELKDEGVPALEAISIAMKEMGLDADLVSNMANTAAGRWSTLVDTFTTLASTITAPIFEGVSSGMGELQKMLDANMPTIQEFAKTLGEGVGAAMTWLKDTAIPALLDAWETAWPLMHAAIVVVYEFISGTVWPYLETAFAWLSDTALPALQGAFQSVWPLIQQAVATFYQFYREVVAPYIQQSFARFTETILPSLQAAFEEVWPKIQAAVKAVYDWLHDVFFPWLQTVAIPWLANTGLPALQKAFETVWPLIETAVRTVYIFFRDTVWPWLQEALRNTTEKEIPAIKKAFEDNWPKIETAVRTVYKFLHDTVWPWLSENIPKVADYLEGVEERWGNAWQRISGAVETAKNAISTTISTIKTLIQGAIDRINDLITAINSIPGVELPTIPTAPATGGGGGSGFGARSIAPSGANGLYATSIAPGAIVINQQPGQDSRVLAAQVADEIDKRNRLARMR